MFSVHLTQGESQWRQQDAEKVRQQRSRIVQPLNVPQRVRLGPSLAAALLDGLFEHPAGVLSCCPRRATIKIPACQHSFSQPAKLTRRFLAVSNSRYGQWCSGIIRAKDEQEGETAYRAGS